MINVHCLRWMQVAVAVFIVLGVFVLNSGAQDSLSSSLGMVVYPSKGQTAEQQSGDEGECYTWAKKETGIDPVAVASAPAEEASSVGGGERLRGAARGAAAGAVIGEIADDDAGKGAGIGAAAGAMRGGRQARKNKAAKEQQAQQDKESTLEHFNKAFSACMEARDYIIK
jgi:hypothetical protein